MLHKYYLRINCLISKITKISTLELIKAKTRDPKKDTEKILNSKLSDDDNSDYAISFLAHPYCVSKENTLNFAILSNEVY